MTDNILQYESEIWATADLLRGCGIKESEWPAYMMPFFALIMIESRLLRLFEDEIERAGGREAFEAMREDDRLALLIDQKQGYNKFLFEQKKSLSEICANDKNFEIDFDAYLNGFDSETKDLLGVDPGEGGDKFLNIKNYISILKSKKVLLGYVKKWSEIDLKPYSNSDITTLEEHIKRRWADMSAETGGEQYTPDDVIALMADIIASKIEPKETLLKIYDPACGGGNLLFGVEDRIKESFPNRYTQTFGQELNDALYALAKIESRFREDSKIEAGNTLTEDKFYNEEFDISVANPPFGVDWKGYASDIRKDKTGRYQYLPSVDDGQLLFTQHLISKMAHDGIAIIVHLGSTLFSGDAGNPESNIRKWMLDADIVEAVIQLPTDEFFNTSIYTYLWVLNKNKKPHQKDKVMLLNASEKFKQLKKSKGSKRKEVDKDSRGDIVYTLNKFQDNDYARVFDKDIFYYNKQAISLTNVDLQGNYLSESIKLSPVKLENGQRELTTFASDTFDKTKYESLYAYFQEDIKPFIDSLDYKEQPLIVTTSTAKYYYDNEQEALIEESKGKKKALGCGKIVVKTSYKSGNKKRGEFVEVTVELTPDTEKDYEIIPFSRDETQNQGNIANFITKFVFKPFKYLGNTIGVELSFNTLTYKPEQSDVTNVVLGEIKRIDDELKILEQKINQLDSFISETIKQGLGISAPMKRSGVEWIGEVPEHWNLYRVKDFTYVKGRIGWQGLRNSDFLEQGEFYCVTGTDFVNGEIDWSNCYYVSQERYEQDRFIKLRIGDLLITKDGTIGKVALVNKLPLRATLNSGVFVTRPLRNKYTNEYMYWILNSSIFKDFINLTKSGSTIQHLYQNVFDRFIYPCPPISEQKKIVDYLNKKAPEIDVLIEAVGSKIARLGDLRKALINDIATGKIRV